MKTTINIGEKNIEFNRNWFTGSFTYMIDGEKRSLASALNPFTHFSFKQSKMYKAKVDETIVTIIKSRPLLFAGLRANNYKFFLDYKLIKEVEEL
ncbi:MAG: hypothetical protein ABIY35_07695 [Chitinophagaceae bacterium]